MNWPTHPLLTPLYNFVSVRATKMATIPLGKKFAAAEK